MLFDPQVIKIMVIDHSAVVDRQINMPLARKRQREHHITCSHVGPRVVIAPQTNLHFDRPFQLISLYVAKFLFGIKHMSIDVSNIDRAQNQVLIKGGGQSARETAVPRR